MTNWAGPYPRKPPRPPEPVRVAEYVRMSTEMQRYSVSNQQAEIAKYCRERDWEVVRTYADEAKSGLTLDGRDGLTSLLRDVIARSHDFSKLVVLDVSRWGRFQDADEGAHYEFLLRQAGVSVVYCAEPFGDDGSPISAIFKSVKRAMAGEYSRDLSAKVFQGQCRLTAEGYWVGGDPGFALRRMLVDERGSPKRLLGPRQRKALQTEHVIVVPGPPEERAVVKLIFRLFVRHRLTGVEIARRLAKADAPRPGQRPWSYRQVYEILTNEKYAGDLIYNRRSRKLRGDVINNPQSEWVRVEDVIQPIVPKALFKRANKVIANHARWKTDEQLLDDLRDLWRRVGLLSVKAILADPDMASLSVYRARFGTITNAYALIGHPVDAQYIRDSLAASLRPVRVALVSRLQAGLKANGVHVHRTRSEILHVDHVHKVAVLVARHQGQKHSDNNWRVRYKTPHRPSIGFVARMAPGNAECLDYFALPSTAVDLCTMRWLGKETPGLEQFRGDDPTRLLLEVIGHAHPALI